MTASSPNNEHVTDWIEPYLAGGLDDEQRDQVRDHIARCDMCAKALAQAESFDASLKQIFTGAAPAAGFEDRMVAGLGRSVRGPLLHPAVRRAAIGIAATVLLGGFGYVASQAIEQGQLPLLGSGARAMAAPQQNAYTSSIDPISRFSTYVEMHDQSEMGRQHGLHAPAELAERMVKRLEETTASPDAAAGEAKPAPPAVASASTLQSNQPASAGDVAAPRGSSVLSLTPAKPGESGYQAGLPALQGGGAGGFGGSGGGGNGRPVSGGGSDHRAKSKSEGWELKNGTMEFGYFRPAGLAEASDREAGKGDSKNGLVAADGEKNGKTSGAAPKDGSDNLFKAVEDGQNQQQGQPGQQPPARPTWQEHEKLSDPKEANLAAGRKVIRNGEMTFEVEGFDSAVMTITKIVDEERGYVSTTDSDKLANGKVKGTIVVRVPPEHLDTLVLKLRGIGELKSQKINAQDITKQYTDLESALRAARAMEARLIEIVKTGKGEVKDLLEAEKQLGVWREKIEQVEGEIRYYNNLVSLSTLSVTLMEKDIKTAAFASETEQVTMALETPNVETAYDQAKQAIAAAKGRILQSDLQQHEAGQFSGTIRAALPPDAADTVIGRLRQLDGRVANFQRQRAQKSQEGSGAPLDASKLHREDVNLNLTLYNLANVEPRRTMAVLLAAPSVDETYRAVLDAVAAASGRVVTSSINRGKPEQTRAEIRLHVASDKADAFLTSLRAAGVVVHSESNENPDTQNVTEAKRGFAVSIESLAVAAPRETQQLKVAAAAVPEGFADLLNAVLSKNGRVITSQLNQQDREHVTGTLSFEVPRDATTAIDAALAKAGDVITRNVVRSQDTENSVDTKVQYSLDLVDAAALPPRQKTTLAVEAADVSRAARDFVAAATSAGGHAAGSTESSLDREGNLLTRVIVDVPLAKAASVIDQASGLGTVRVNETSTDEHASEGRLARARIEVTFGNTSATVGGRDTIWDAIRHGLSVSGAGLRWSLTMIVIGFCFIAPWALIVWALWRVFRHKPARLAVVVANSTASPSH